MRFASAIIIIFSLSILPGLLQAGTRVSAQPQAGAGSTVSADDIQAVRQDVQRMKVLVQQMEQNLAFVDVTQSPLKHQFQLEIDMWKTVIAEMERKLNSSKQH